MLPHVHDPTIQVSFALLNFETTAIYLVDVQRVLIEASSSFCTQHDAWWTCAFEGHHSYNTQYQKKNG